MLSIIFLILIVFALLIPTSVYATSNSTSTITTHTSNHVKYCKTLKDRQTRSIICPDVFSSSETSFVPGG